MIKKSIFLFEDSSIDPRPLIQNGRVNRIDYSYGSSIELRCNFGYRLRGSRVLSCVNGTWDKSIPECRSKTTKMIQVKQVEFLYSLLVS